VSDPIDASTMPPGSAGSSKGKDLKLVVVGSGGELAWTLSRL
jgi:hypothetical protein